MKRWFTSVAILAPCLLTSFAQASECKGPWQRVPEVGSALLRPVPLGLLGGAVAAPLILVPTGADHDLRGFSQTKLNGSYRPETLSLFAPHVVIGGTVVAYITGTVLDSCPVRRTASSMIQGIAGAVAMIALSKWATGRTWPNGGRDPDADDRLDYPKDAKDFGPFSHGINAAFPSGHTAVLFAAAAALRGSGDGQWWRYAGYPIALGVGFGMWFGDHHWASDVLSGALLGEAIGGAAGRAWNDNAHDKSGLSWFVLPAQRGVVLGGQHLF